MNNIKFVNLFKKLFIVIAVLYGISKFVMPVYAIEDDTIAEETPVVEKIEEKPAEEPKAETPKDETPKEEKKETPKEEPNSSDTSKGEETTKKEEVVSDTSKGEETTKKEEVVVDNSSNEDKKEEQVSIPSNSGEQPATSDDEEDPPTVGPILVGEKTDPVVEEPKEEEEQTNPEEPKVETPKEEPTELENNQVENQPSSDNNINENTNNIKSSPTRGDSDKVYDVTDYITGVTIDAPKDNQGRYIIRPGAKYHVIMNFAETLSNQFPNDGKLEYVLPEGFLDSVKEESGTFTINVTTADGVVTVPENHYNVKDGIITITWSDKEEVQKLFAANNAKFFIKFWGSFDGEHEIIKYNDVVVTPIHYDKKPSSIEMVKKSTTPTINPNTPYVTNKIDYVISITSTGINNDVNISDIIQGNGVTLTRPIVVTSNEELNYTLDIDEVNNKFTFHADTLIDGQTININYSAILDEKFAIKDDDNSFYIRALNEAKLVTEGQDDITRRTDNKIVVKPSLQKTGTLQDDGTIKWVISVNVNNKLLIKDMPIIDTIDPNSRAYMHYDGDGLTVYVYDSKGLLVGGEPITVPWSQLINFSDAGWTYMIPSNDDHYHYEIEYTTGYDHAGMDKVLKNDVHFGDNDSSASVYVKGDDDVDIEKKATDVDIKGGTITWEILIHVPKSGLTEEDYTITDTFPSKWIDDRHAIEALINGSVLVSGLTGSERYVIDVQARTATIKFYKDGGNNPGLNGTGYQRDIKIILQTEIDPEWLSHSTSSDDTSFITHTNTISMSHKTESGSVDVALPTLEKKGEEIQTVTIDNVSYPVLKYNVLFGLIDETSIQLEDIFDTEIFKMYIPEDETDMYLVTLGGDKIYNTTHQVGGYEDRERIDYIQTPDGIKFLIGPDKLAKDNNGNLYKYYTFSYYLMPKDLQALRSLMQKATDNNGEFAIGNKIKYKDELEADAEVIYKYSVFDKKQVGEYDKETSTVNFEIEINPDELILNNGDSITLVDTYNNMSIVYDSIVITPSDGVSYDASGNTITFLLPDAQRIVITYSGRLYYDTSTIGDVTINYSNSATLITGTAEITKNVDGIVELESDGGGTAAVYSVKLLKYEAGNMSKRLAGAVFELLDASTENIIGKNGKVTFTTGSDGVAIIEGNQDKDGWSLSADTRYFLRETFAPEGFQLPNFLYSFMIASNGVPDYTPGNYIYINGDILTAKNYPGTDIFVEKEWEDGNDRHSSDEVTVELQEKVGDGEWTPSKTKSPIVLNADNDWKGKFNELLLVVTTDEGEDVAVEYRIVETHVNGVPVEEDAFIINPKEGTPNTYIIFNYGVYEAFGDIEFIGEKTLTGKKLEAGAYSFELVDANGDVIQTVTNDKDGKFAFDKILYTLDDLDTDADGNYIATEVKYSIREAVAEEAGMTFDDTVYDITVTLTDKGDGTIEAVSDLDKAGFTFENIYEATGDIEFSGEKTLTGKKLEEGAYSFELVDANGDVIQTVTNDKDGKFSFEKILYTLDDLDTDDSGNYVATEVKYSIREAVAEEAGMTFDDTVYEIIVTLTDDGKGKIEAVSNLDTAGFTFENIYEATGDIEFSGEKTLIGKKLEAGAYSFELLDADNNVIQTVTNDKDGKFAFDKILYTLDDLDTDDSGNYVATEVKYSIREAVAEEAGMTFDDTVYEIIVTLTDDGKGKIEAVSNLDTAGFTFENVYEATGDIEFSGEKILDGKKLQRGQFEFELLDADGEVIQTVSNDAEGKFKFSKIFYTMDDLDIDNDGNYITTEKHYSIREVVTDTAGYTFDDTIYEITVTLTDNGDGTLKVVSDPDKASFSFTNEYDATGDIEFSGEKILTGKKLEEGAYSFELVDADNNVIQTVTNDKDGKFAFEKILYTLDELDKDDNGNYIATEVKYSIREVITEEAGMTFDDTVYEITVTLTDDGKGNIEAVSDLDTAGFTFENKYEATGDIEFSGEKTLTGKDLEEGAYSFELVDADEKVIQTVSNDEEGKFSFEKILYTLDDLDTDDNGNYIATEVKYSIREVIIEEAGMTFDDTVYEIIVTLTDKGDGTIEAVSNLDKASFNFINEYNATGDIEFSGEKTLTGKKLEEGAYSFELLDVDNNVIQTVTNDKDGKFTFETISYTLEDLDTDDKGNYIATEVKYSIREVITEEAGMTFDDTVYEIIVTLTDKGDGTIEAVSNLDTAGFTFENIYEATGDIEFSGEKTLTGRKLEEGAFSFELLDADGKVIQTVTNDKDGKFSFEKLSYTLEDLDKDEDGSYKSTEVKYSIREVVTEAAGYTFDDTVYEIIVTLTDNGDGTIKAESNLDKASFTFENTYDATGDIEFSGEKTLNGKKLEEGAFSFELLDADGELIETVSNDADGKFAFTKLSYTLDDLDKDEEGNYKATEVKYSIREVIGKETGIVFDETVYEITVSLTDDGKGTIEANSDLDKAKFNFINEYYAHVSVSKVDVADGEEVEGATIQVLDKNGKVVEEWVSTNKTHVVDGLTVGEEYKLIETVAPDGYTIAQAITFVIDEEGCITTTGSTTTDEEGNPVILVEDEKTNVKISKVDFATGEEIEGATIQILDKNGKVVEEWTSTGEVHVVEGLKTGEEYKIKETVAPEGYTIAEEITFVIGETGKVTTTGKTSTDGKIILIEDKLTIVRITKVDITTKKEVPGATLQVIDSKGNIIDEWVSTTETHIIEGLKTGEEYTLKETVAPEGYKVTSDSTFTIDEKGKVTTTGKTTTDSEGNIVILVEDEKIKVVITKIDITTKKELEGAKLQVVDKEGTIIDEWISTKEGHVIEGLKPGEEYTLKEIVAPTGYEITTDITFTIDEEGIVTTTGSTTTDDKGNTVILVEDTKTPNDVPPPPDNPPTADFFEVYMMLLQLFILGFISGGIYLRRLNKSL